MKRTVVTLLDDLDPDINADETIEFMLDGERYEIDLSDRNASKLRDQLEPWRTAARRMSGARRRQQRPQRQQVDRSYNTSVRTWARENGHRVSPRGRLPADVINAYEVANS